MKSKRDFITEEEYIEYLQIYFTSVALTGLLTDKNAAINYSVNQAIVIGKEIVKRLDLEPKPCDVCHNKKCSCPY